MPTMTDTRSALPEANARPGLTTVLRIDATTCAVMGAVLLAATQWLAPLLGLPATLLTWAGVWLACAVPMLVVAVRQRPPAATLVLFIVLGNLAWVLTSGYVAFAIDTITEVGRVLVIVQALAVLAIAGLEWRGLASQRR